MAELGIKLKQGELENLPYKQQLMIAQAQRAMQLANESFGGHVPGGAVGQSYWKQKLIEKYGQDAPIVEEAQKQIDFRK